MKVSEAWLRELVALDCDRQTIVETLTMAGLEVDAVEPAAGDFSEVYVGEIIACEKHPEADRLKCCKVSLGNDEPLDIVCGGANARTGIKVAVAVVGAKIGELKIKKAKLRGQPSHGMLCSASELGLADSSDGIIELPQDAPLGTAIVEYLKLDDACIDIDLTPNRSDCLSHYGIARELAALCQSPLQLPEISKVAPSIDSKLNVTLAAPKACSRYAGRVIRGVNNQAASPLWLQERLRRSGIRSIDAIVDVTNYVMIELGQPMHAFDLAQLDGAINVRMAQAQEKLTLLDGQELTLNDECLVIADNTKALALAGIMGGEHSGVTADTQDIFLESAYFDPIAIAGKARQFALHTESSHRFERGVDPELAVQAIERATALLLEIVGGAAGPVEVASSDELPQPVTISLDPQKVNRVSGMQFSTAEVTQILTRLGMQVQAQGDSLEVSVPSYRFDLRLDVDLIEEVIRVHGYHLLPHVDMQATLHMQALPEAQVTTRQLSELLRAQGFSEAINYSFVSKAEQQALLPSQPGIDLLNPLSHDLGQMRVSLLPGLLRSVAHNQHRQQVDVRLFETGLVFLPKAGEVEQKSRIAGVMVGSRAPQQWGISHQPVDFFDIKASIEAIIASTRAEHEFAFQVAEHEALHPGQSALITRGGEQCGWVGALHPEQVARLDLQGPVYVFELDLALVQQGLLPRFTPLSKFPAIRRDLGLLVRADVPAQDVVATIAKLGGELVIDIAVFDVYQGENLAEGHKSMALALILQHRERTLVDSEVNELIDAIVLGLNKELGITLRE